MTKIKTYRQYSKCKVLVALTEALNGVFAKHLEEASTLFRERLDFRKYGLSDFFVFFADKYFNLYFQQNLENQVGTLYDSGLKYDSSVAWDDTGNISFDYALRKLYAFKLDYQNRVVNQAVLLRFFADLLECKPNEIKLEFRNKEQIIYKFPKENKNSAKTIVLLNINQNLLPFGVNFGFEIY